MVEYLTNRFKAIVGIDEIELDMHIDGEDDGSEKLRATEQTMESFDDRIDRLCQYVEGLESPQVDEDNEAEKPGKSSPSPPPPKQTDVVSDPIQPFVQDEDECSINGSIKDLKNLHNSSDSNV